MMECNLGRIINWASFELVIVNNDESDRSVLDEMTDENE